MVEKLPAALAELPGTNMHVLWMRRFAPPLHLITSSIILSAGQAKLHSIYMAMLSIALVMATLLLIAAGAILGELQ